MYTIRVDERTRLICATISGMLTVAEARAYASDLGATFVRHRLRGDYLLLLDVSAATVQQQDVIAAFQAHMASFPKARRIAIVCGSSLARMQVRRVFTQPYAQVFEVLADARRWLAEAEAAPA